MSVKIILSKTSEPAEKRELVVNEEAISLGREPSNVVPLPGTQVSKLHARIERQGSDYYIVDLNSTNCTYVNGEKLTPGTQRTLRDGDRVSIADYDLEFFPVHGSTARSLSPNNQTPVETRTTAASLHSDEVPSAAPEAISSDLLERWSTLTTEIQNSLESFGIRELARSHEALLARCNALEEENRRLRTERFEPSHDEQRPSETAREFVPSENARLEQIARVLLQLFHKLSSGRSSFLSEFIVRTMIRTTSDLPVQPRSDDEILRYFADPALSDREFAERFALLKKEADQIVLHMIGILEGYRRSVDEGTRRILQRVDPDRLEEEVPDTALMRYIPPLAELKLFHLIRNRLRDLLQEDRGVLEKQVFRPGFARAYEECVEPSSTRV